MPYQPGSPELEDAIELNADQLREIMQWDKHPGAGGMDREHERALVGAVREGYLRAMQLRDGQLAFLRTDRELPSD